MTTSADPTSEADDLDLMDQARAAAAAVRCATSPNPWVGAAIRTAGGAVVVGATEPPPGRHAERVALDRLEELHGRDAAVGATVAVTLEPCSHQGRTGPCADALVAAGVARVVVALEDPDPLVAGKGNERLAAAGIEVDLGCGAAEVEAQLAAYLHHRRTGRPYVVLKLAATIDGRTAAPDSSSQWITGPAARADAHQLRAESDAVIVGAGTVRADDPSLTVRDWAPESMPEGRSLDPRRIVLGAAPESARVHPCEEVSGPLDQLLDRLGTEGVLQVMVEGGASVAADFHRAGLVDRYRVYIAPALFGGDDGHPLFTGAGAPTMADLWRGELADVRQVGNDLALDVVPTAAQRDRGEVT